MSKRVDHEWGEFKVVLQAKGFCLNPLVEEFLKGVWLSGFSSAMEIVEETRPGGMTKRIMDQTADEVEE